MCANQALTSNTTLPCRPELPLEAAGPQLQQAAGQRVLCAGVNADKCSVTGT
jgi:hypothetical protein